VTANWRLNGISADHRGPIDDLIPVGPFEVRVELPPDVKARTIRHLVSNTRQTASVKANTVVIPVKSILDHEVVVIGA